MKKAGQAVGRARLNPSRQVDGTYQTGIGPVFFLIIIVIIIVVVVLHMFLLLLVLFLFVIFYVLFLFFSLFNFFLSLLFFIRGLVAFGFDIIASVFVVGYKSNGNLKRALVSLDQRWWG